MPERAESGSEREAGAVSPGEDRPALDPAELYALKVLQGVSLEQVEDLLGRCELRELAPGEVLIRMGQENRVMYMVLGGKLSVHLDAPSGEAVAYLGAGETVGELSVIDARPASAYVVADEPTRLLEVDEGSFWNLALASHDFAINLLAVLAERLRANNRAVSDNIRLQREYKQRALIDGLTGLHNRRWLDEALPRFVARYARGDHALSVFLADVDHFKSINDTFGHPAGDRVLVHVAQTLRQNLRPTDLVARYGGEEFLVILPDTAGPGARHAAERVRQSMRAADVVTADGVALPPVTISIGCATLGQEQTLASLIAVADAALYESKRAGRDRVTVGAAPAG